MSANTLQDYIYEKIADQPDAARLIVVFDPLAALEMNQILEDEHGRVWGILPYDGNDLAFRKSQASVQFERILVWVTAGTRKDIESTPRLTLNSLMDVWSRADLHLDANLTGILRTFVPNETWPEAPINEHAGILSQNLPAVVEGVHDLRRYLPRQAALDSSSVRALALHCLRPDISANQFLFLVDTPAAILKTYLDLLWKGQWDDAGRFLLQQQSLQAPRLPAEEIQPWLKVPAPQLALYLYLRRLLELFRVPNIANQLRGLDIVDVDAAALEPHVWFLLERWQQDMIWRNEIIIQAEAILQEEDILRVVDLVHFTTIESIMEAIRRAETPATLFALIIKFFQQGVQNKDFSQYTSRWSEYRNPLIANFPETTFDKPAKLLVDILDDVAFIDERRGIGIQESSDLAKLLDWYVAEKLYDLEYAHARVSGNILYIPEFVRSGIKNYVGFQKEWIRSFLDMSDHALAKVIQSNWNSFVSHARLSTNVLWDTVKKRRLLATIHTRVWMIVFDGMRWDTWMRHVRPRLLQHFEIITEKPYLSLLPSWTQIARTGLLAGRPPAGWQNFEGSFTRNQGDLVAKLFGISRQERDRQLNFFSGMESDRKLDQLMGGKRFPYNVLIYNISDDNLHGMKGNLLELNKVVDTLLDNIIQALINVVEPEDTVVIASDHGFVELGERDGIEVREDNRWQRQIDGDPNPVHYRFISSHQIPKELETKCTDSLLQVSYPGLKDEYTVAVGRRWFKRTENRGPEDRYAHGGISFAEMTVPGAVLKRITQKRIKPELIFEPTTITVLEGTTVELGIQIINKGNIELTGQMSIQTDPVRESAGQPLVYTLALDPGDAGRFVYPVKGYYRKRGRQEVESTQAIKIALTYRDSDGKEKSINRRVQVAVTPRTDKVEIDFGGLPDIDVR